MTDGYEEAKAGRNVLERLGEKIPGYRGFQDRELWRDVERLPALAGKAILRSMIPAGQRHPT